LAEWLVEHGIGEQRALLVENGSVVAAKTRWPGELRAGQMVHAKLVSRHAGKDRGVARTDAGREILVDKLPRGASEGATIGVAVTRAAIAERGRLKRAQGRYFGTDREPPEQDPASDVFLLGDAVRRLPDGLWEEVWDAAWEGEIAFAGGSLLLAVTPAMTVIDIDGDLPPRELALAAVAPLTRALRWFDCGGSIGVDFPTLPAKADRRAVDNALDSALAEWPHERTAMNGFGFVQLVARQEGPSLLHRMASSRVGAAARAVLRRAEGLEGAGAIRLTVHPALKAKLKPEWLDELARRTGREVSVETDPGIALGAGHAQMVER